MKQRKSLKFKILIGLVVLLLIAVSGFLLFVSSSYEAQSLALENLKSDSQVTVEQNGDILFKPVSNAKDTGYVFYPGAKVEPAAYAPMAKEITSKGYTVVIAKIPFNLAILSPNKADAIIKNYPAIDRWVIGGHSLGGVMASDYVLKNDKVKGLILLASYPQAKTDLSTETIEVLSMWGSNDEVADVEKIKDAKNVMPSDAVFIELPGGNHAGFGDYGHQKGDGEATIPNEQQLMETSSHSIELLDRVNEN